MERSILVWTRDSGARETIPLVLSRIGESFARCEAMDEVVDAVEQGNGPVLLVLGPTFSEEEATEIGTTLCDRTSEACSVVLLEDLSDPLPSHIVIPAPVSPTRVRLPVRPRTLRKIVEAWKQQLEGADA